MSGVINGVPEGLNKTREQWQKIDAKQCANSNSSAANFYLIRDAQQDIERLHRALAAAPAQPAAPDRVSVPRELLQDLHDLASDAVEHHRAAFAGYKLKRQANMEHVVDKARAILASAGQEE